MRISCISARNLAPTPSEVVGHLKTDRRTCLELPEAQMMERASGVRLPKRARPGEQRIGRHV